MNQALLISISCFLLFLSCSNPFVTTPGTQGKNLVTGLNVTNSESPQVLYRWGNPDFPNEIKFEPEITDTSSNEAFNIPEYFRMEAPYPNPADGNMSIRVDFPRRFHVKVWMETASLNINETQLPSGLYNPGEFQNFVLYDQLIPRPGAYNFNMNKKTKCFGGELNQGFFRVFVQVDGKHTLWQDIYIGGFREDAPPAFRNFNGAYPCSDFPDQINN